ncbi:MAG TPA: hypothetical protein VHV30_15910 [Polyangiaceae bacterium]|jgi:hypothetical protein|nr:hypothetical protein [Polyangiaceae bacterium]
MAGALGALGLVGVAIGAPSCANTGTTSGAPPGSGMEFGVTDDGGGGSFGGSSSGASAMTDCSMLMRPCDSCTDFPAQPIIDTLPDDGSPATPSDAASHFTDSSLGSNGPCVSEPSDGALIPQNWLRPRFKYAPASASQTLFELRLHTPRQKNDLLVYTTSKTWKMPKTIWDAVRASTWDEDITLTVRSVDPTNASAKPAGSQSTFRIAPAVADGAMIYWAAVGENDGQSWLEGFNVGDEGVTKVLDVTTTQEKISRDQGGNLQNGTGKVQCIGCHTAVPDGKSVAFIDFYPWTGVAASVEDKHEGEIPSWLTPGGAEAFSQPWLGIMSFSPTAWGGGDHAAVVTYQNTGAPWDGQSWSDAPNSRLAWIDLSSSAPSSADAGAGTNSNSISQYVQGLEGTSYGFIARNGDSRGAEGPTWSHDGRTIVYVSTNAAKDGRLASGTADLYSVPYNNRMGGSAMPVMGASDPNTSEYYPSFSPDDKYLAFDSAPGSETMYYNPHSEVDVVAAAGGTSTRLNANAPPACTGATSPGVTNSWAKWSPQVTSCNGKIYYWIIFSSSRLGVQFNSSNLKSGGQVPTSQLYVTALVDNGGGKLSTYPALYIWNQPTTYTGTEPFNGSPQSNHTPTWEIVDIPPVPPPTAK